MSNPLKFSKPNTSSTRGMVKVNKSHLWKGSSEKSLTKSIKNHGGRNNLGRITCFGKRNTKRRLYRQIDFSRNQNVEGYVERIEYDPNRTAHIALIKNTDGSKNYVIATKNMIVGSKVASGDKADTLEGNCLKLLDIPLGSHIHNIEITPGKGAQMVRSAGATATLVGKELGQAIIALPSKELRRFSLECRATLGVISNEIQFNENLARAGSNFHRNKRPKVRGVARNPVDHAMGGRSNGGPSRSKNGNVLKGRKTRARHKWSNSLIVSRRPNKQAKGAK
jgi:large subunit ribosomal protein L2